MARLMKRFLRNERGATAIEYGLILSLMFLAIVASVQLFAAEARAVFAGVTEAIVGAIGG